MLIHDIEWELRVETTLDGLAINSHGNYDWTEVFKFGVEPTSVDGASRETFALEEVAAVLASADGSNDGPPWVMLGRLKDTRFFFISADCDNSGWDCQASGSAMVGLDLLRLLDDIPAAAFHRLFAPRTTE